MSDLATTFAGKRLFITGATGFLGKVFLAKLLRDAPGVARVSVLVRRGAAVSVAERIEAEIVRSPALASMPADAVRARLEGIEGDTGKPRFGLTEAAWRELAGRLDLVIHCAGLVDFSPPLDEALSVNVEGTRAAITLAAAAGAPLLHTSTCFVSGSREGRIDERVEVGDYPLREKLGFDGFDPEREVEFCRALVERTRGEADDPSVIASELPKHRGDPALARKAAADRARGLLRDLGKERARRYGFPNTYTYSKAVAEQLVAAARDRGEVRAVVCRPAILESALSFPVPGWNQGANTTAPLLYMIYRGHRMWPTTPEHVLDVLPIDMAAGAMVAIAARTLDGTAAPLYQLGSGDSNRLPVRRAIELSALHYRRRPVPGAGTLLTLAARTFLESTGVPERTYRAVSLPLFARAAKLAKSVVEAAAGPREAHPGSTSSRRGLARMLKKLRQGTADAEKSIRKTSQVVEEYVPFIAGPRAIYETRATRALRDGLSARDREIMAYEPETIDWRRYWLDVHLPGLEKWVYPELDRMTAPKPRKKKPEAATADSRSHREHRDHRGEIASVASVIPVAPAGFVTVLDLFEAAVARDPQHPMLERLSGASALARVAAGAARLRARGVKPGDRVALVGENSTAWVLGYLAILAAGATAVPLDASLAARDLHPLVKASRAKGLYASAKRREAFAMDRERPAPARAAAASASVASRSKTGGPKTALETLSLEDLTAPDAATNGGARLPTDVARDPEAAASLIYTSGTTGAPKGVLLPHRAFCSQVAALGAIYDLGPADRIVSILPLHHAFEFTCGLLLPLSAGATMSFAAAATPEAVRAALRRVRPTAMIAVPALLEAFLRSIRREVRAAAGNAADRISPAARDAAESAAERALDAAIASHRALRDATGANYGRRLFAPAHEAFGGSLRFLVSGGAALPRAAFEAFRGLGFDIYEGYGLTEAAPVVATCRPGARARAGHVGEPIFGTEVQLRQLGDDGAGEVLVRGPGVMLGYDGDASATAAVLDAEGWLATGDLGRLDRDGSLAIVGRVKDAVVDGAGNTVYPDEIEELYGAAEGVAEIGVARVHLADGKEVVGALVLPRDGAARAAILERFREIDATLPFPKRLKVVEFADGPLPRTATRKVKRAEVAAILRDRLAAARDGARASVPDAPDTAAGLRARRLVADLAGVEPATIALEARLQEDLGLDSLAHVELASAVGEETKRGAPASLEGVRTVADVARLLGGATASSEAPGFRPRASGKPPASVDSNHGPSSDLKPGARSSKPASDSALPALVKAVGNSVLTWLQTKAYEGPLRADVTGRAHIPEHTNALVVSNHCSHLDLGLLKHALGDWGRHAASLGARDYFFSTPLRKLYFESFTEVVPLDRQDSSRERLDGVVERITSGETVILFPEGTRSTTGEMGPFRSGLGYLVLKARTGVLPVYLDGTHAALPKGATVPRSRDVGARIGKFMPYEELAKAVEGMTRHEAYRVIGELVRGAIERLRDGDQAPALTPSKRVAGLLGELPLRHRAGRVDVAKTFYVKIGDGQDERWTIRLEPERCAVTPGKADGPADCVVRSTPEVLEKLLRDGDGPTFEDIATGAFKTNDPDALRLLVEALGLGERASR